MLHVLILALLAQAPTARQPPAAKKPDACALLADADVRTVLGVTVKERQPGTQQARGLLLSQCYLGTGTPRSVSIAVAGNTRSGGKTVTPRAFWRDQFHGRDEHASERKAEKREAARQGEKGEQEGETEARRIAGIGDEASGPARAWPGRCTCCAATPLSASASVGSTMRRSASRNRASSR